MSVDRPSGAVPDAGLIGGFLRSADRHPDRTALVAGGETLTYSELLAGARAVAATIDSVIDDDARLCAVLGVGTAAVYQSILGVLLTGRAYVPLNPAFPAARTSHMLEASGVDLVIVDRVGEDVLPALLAEAEPGLELLLPHIDGGRVDELSAAHPGFTFLGTADMVQAGDLSAVPVHGGDPAYLMFTSGSTGRPKGVVVTNGNVRSFVATAVGMYQLGPDDRFSQMFDLTFDLSVFDMFVCWEVGASLWVIPPRSRMAPAAFIRKSQLTVWFSVPAVAGSMRQLNMLRPDSFPTLRYSLFCGEPLPASVTQAWQEAAPRSRLDNLYGPTELTIACTWHTWDSRTSPDICLNGIVPIGGPYESMESAIVDEALERVGPGDAGELCLRGPQTTPGYWQRPDLTAERFVPMPWFDGPDNRWYRTGDLVRMHESGAMQYVGRVDNQVKIRGYRVELGEVENRLREYGMTEFAIAVPWPARQDGVGATGLVACLAGSQVEDDVILDACRRDLPDYMVPKWILRLETMPLNVNRKIDRNALRSIVEEHGGRR